MTDASPVLSRTPAKGVLVDKAAVCILLMRRMAIYVNVFGLEMFRLRLRLH